MEVQSISSGEILNWLKRQWEVNGNFEGDNYLAIGNERDNVRTTRVDIPPSTIHIALKWYKLQPTQDYL